MVSDGHVRRATMAAAVAELAWLDVDRRPRLWPATPLWLAGQPALAFTYARAELVRSVATAPAVALVLSDTRATGSGWQPLVLTGQPRLVEDRDGEVFVGQLLEQELRKYPPSRALADSPLLRREHWWYLPRLLLLVDVDLAGTVGARRDGAGSVLAVAARHGGRTDEPGEGAGPGEFSERGDLSARGENPGRGDGNTALVVDTVRGDERAAEERAAEERAADDIHLISLDGRTVPDGPAALLGHDFSVPDLERWTSWLTLGELRDEVMRVDERPSRTTLEPTPGLLQRFRRQRELEKACRRALSW